MNVYLKTIAESEYKIRVKNGKHLILFNLWICATGIHFAWVAFAWLDWQWAEVWRTYTLSLLTTSEAAGVLRQYTPPNTAHIL